MTTLFLGFAAVGAILAIVGVYGVVAQLAQRRTQEIGIRLALGARPGDVARLVAGQGLVLTAGGLVVGLPAAFTVVRFLSTFLYGVTAHDPGSFAGGAALVLIVSAAACVAPVRRAARVDPLKALRADR